MRTQPSLWCLGGSVCPGFPLLERLTIRGLLSHRHRGAFSPSPSPPYGLQSGIISSSVSHEIQPNVTGSASVEYNASKKGQSPKFGFQVNSKV